MNALGSKLKDHTGRTFGKLTAICPVKSDKGTVWRCLCECGNTSYHKGPHLDTGRVKSCGNCVNIKITKLNNDTWKYTDRKGIYFLFSDIDYATVTCNSCYVGDGGYVCTSRNGITTRLHTLIMLTPTGLRVDHIDNNTLNNTRDNLRICTVSQNGMNTPLYANNSSGVTGVWYSSRDSLWYAEIMYNSTKLRLGSFKERQDAVDKRHEAEIKYFGEFRYVGSTSTLSVD